MNLMKELLERTLNNRKEYEEKYQSKPSIINYRTYILKSNPELSITHAEYKLLSPKLKKKYLMNR